MVALLCVDIDRFKRINDSHGHAAGDRLLQAVTERLLSCLRSTDFIGRAESGGPVLSRLAGDEFTVVLRRIRSSEDTSIAARRILEALRTPFPIDGGEVSLGASIGIALFPGDGEDAETLLRNAQAAIDAAKQRGGSVYQFFSESMNELRSRALRIETLLRSGLARGELSLVYQPQLEVSSGRVVAVEALVRWESPDLGTVGPSDFIPVAEESGLILELGFFVLQQTCRQLAAWQRRGDPSAIVAVNVRVASSMTRTLRAAWKRSCARRGPTRPCSSSRSPRARCWWTTRWCWTRSGACAPSGSAWCSMTSAPDSRR